MYCFWIGGAKIFGEMTKEKILPPCSKNLKIQYPASAFHTPLRHVNKKSRSLFGLIINNNNLCAQI